MYTLLVFSEELHDGFVDKVSLSTGVATMGHLRNGLMDGWTDDLNSDLNFLFMGKLADLMKRGKFLPLITIIPGTES
jgi:hypothetical protein